MKDFIDKTYGKFGHDNLKEEIIMEYNKFFPYINSYIPEKMRENSDFMDYLSRPNILEDFAEMFVMTLPGDRISYYKTSNVEKLRHDVF